MTRRDMFQAAGVAAMTIGAGSAAAAPGTEIKLGVASYSLREFSRRLSIKMMKDLGVKYVNIKEFHLPYVAKQAERIKLRAEYEKAGLIITGGGTISLRLDEDDDIRFYFQYAKDCGMPMMVVAPNPKALGRIEKHAKEFDIKVAIHNHGPEEPNFPTGQSALKLIKDMDPRMGICLDIGHNIRGGGDILECIQMAGPRLLDMHVKDLKNTTQRDSQVPVGDGVLPIVPIFKELKKMNYQGHVMLEYEIDGDAPFAGMQKSFAYMRGVIAGLAG